MIITLKLINLSFLMCLFSGIKLFSQDPFFINYYNNESLFNPAMVGYKGALSFNATYKSQWNNYNVSGFKSTNLNFEESLPCSYFDYGLNINLDQEGDGFLNTLDLGMRGAGTIPLKLGQSNHNFRIGCALQWSVKSIDYNKLIFSDELDQKYGYNDKFGNDLKSAFIPPNDGRSLWFFTPAFGFTHRVLLNRNKLNSPTLLYGFSFHNAFSLGNSNFTGSIESILRTNTKIPTRYSYFTTYEFIPFSIKKSFISLKPLFLYERQLNLQYIEFGNKFSFNRDVALGIYYHFNNQVKEGWNSNWCTFYLEIGKFLQTASRIDIGFSYSDSFTGIRNQFGAIFEASVSIHFASSPSCNLVGKKDQVPYDKDYKCYTTKFSPSKRKMYENIWFRPKEK